MRSFTTDQVELLALDETHLGITAPKRRPSSVTRIAELIKDDIKKSTGLTASADVSYNKFLAKLASSMNKPDGLTVILSEAAEAILEGRGCP